MVSQNSVNNSVQDNDFSVNRALAATAVQSSCDHSDNTSTSSDAKFLAEVGGTSGGDPHVNFNIPATQDYSLGIDNTDSDNLKITDGADPSSGSTYLTFDQATTNIWSDGISFDAGTNVLDEYEEGSWTPAMTFGGGSTGLTFDIQNGTYRRIGQLVCVFYEIRILTVGSSVGGVSITGLPYGSNLGPRGNNAIRTEDVAFAGTTYACTGALLTTSEINVIAYGDNQAFVNLTDAECQVGSAFSSWAFFIT